MKGISAVVPVYQSESSLEELCGVVPPPWGLA